MTARWTFILLCPFHHIPLLEVSLMAEYDRDTAICLMEFVPILEVLYRSSKTGPEYPSICIQMRMRHLLGGPTTSIVSLEGDLKVCCAVFCPQLEKNTIQITNFVGWEEKCPSTLNSITQL